MIVAPGFCARPADGIGRIAFVSEIDLSPSRLDDSGPPRMKDNGSVSSGAFRTLDIPKSRSEENPVEFIIGSSVKAGNVFMAIDETAEQDERMVSQRARDIIQQVKKVACSEIAD